MKMVKREMKKGMLVKGKAAATKKGMKQNVKVMEKKAKRAESKGLKKAMSKRGK
jgi:hypothetical protein